MQTELLRYAYVLSQLHWYEALTIGVTLGCVGILGREIYLCITGNEEDR